MHIILANIPWGSAWSPLVDEEADGTWMAVDYVRIYKPEALLDPTPDTDLREPRAEIALDKTYSLAEDGCIYFSAEITKKPGEELTLTFTDTDNAPVGKVIVDAEGSLLTGITRLTSSKAAASVVQGKQLVKDNEKTLLVCRITAKAARGKYDKDAISVWCAPGSRCRQSAGALFLPQSGRERQHLRHAGLVYQPEGLFGRSHPPCRLHLDDRRTLLLRTFPRRTQLPLCNPINTTEKMKHWIPGCLLLLAGCSPGAMTAPAGKLSAEVFTTPNGSLAYTVSYDGRMVCDTSSMASRSTESRPSEKHRSGLPQAVNATKATPCEAYTTSPATMPANISGR